MKLLLLLLLPVLASAQCDNTLPSGRTCGPQDFFNEADPEACSMYYHCDSGCVTHSQCEPKEDGLPLVWDEQYDWCGLRTDVECGTRPCLDDSICSTTTRTTTTIRLDCGHKADCAALGDGWFPDPFNCRKYWHCYKGDGEHLMCPDDPATGEPEVFNLKYDGCDFQANVECGSRPMCDECDQGCGTTISTLPSTPSTAPPPPCGHNVDCSSLADGYYPDPSNCRQYTHCVDHEGEHFTCPDDPATGNPEVFDLVYDGCNFQEITNCGDRPICDRCDENCVVPPPGPDCGPDSHHPPTICQGRPDGYYPDLFNCGKYWHCAAAHGTHMACDEGLYYEATKVQCDWPDRVDCGSRPVCDICDEGCHPQD